MHILISEYGTQISKLVFGFEEVIGEGRRKAVSSQKGLRAAKVEGNFN